MNELFYEKPSASKLPGWPALGFGLAPFRKHLLLALVLGILPLTGCGDSDGVAPVRGTVTLNGEPLTEGFVFVTPAQGRMAKGEIQSDGSFVLGTFSSSDGVQVGNHPVTVVPPTAQEGAPVSATAKALPKRYQAAQTSGITVEVKPGVTNELVVELQSQ